MALRNKTIISLFFISQQFFCQGISGVYKIDDLIKRISNNDSNYVVNFWATWCKPCVEELPAFDSLSRLFSKTNNKVILVSLDFKEDLEKKVVPFLKNKKIESTCVLLDEVNGNNFINQINKDWSGAIPATLFINQNRKLFLEKKMRLTELQKNWQSLIEH
ncbi:MAG: TlpA disulfide reductase family protein [Bacteroidota bacterium]